MADYQDIRGLRVKYLSADPGDPVGGEVWYNSTTGTLKSVVSTEAISSGSPLVYTAYNGGMFGTQTAAVFGGGFSPNTNPPGAGPPYVQTQQYNGSGWAVGGNLNNGRGDDAGIGTETAGLVAGGTSAPLNVKAEEYDGSTWTNGGDLTTGRRLAGGASAGTQTAGLVWQGWPDSALTEEYNGASWSEVADLNTASAFSSGAGSQTAALNMGGNNPTAPGVGSEEWNGASWTAGNNMANPRGIAAAFGGQTAAVVGGGANPPTTYLTAVEKYDGTSFSASPASLSSTRAGLGAAGGSTASTAGIFAGGYSPVDTPSGDYGNRIVEQFNQSANVVTAAAWASGGAMGTARYQQGGTGTQNAGLAYGGYSSSPAGTKNITEEYNGTSWAAGNVMAENRGQCSGQNVGSQTAALAIGGTTGGSPNYGPECEEYDGTNWSSGGSLTEGGGRSYVAGFGVVTAAVAGGGYAAAGDTANSEEYNGTSWTAGNNMQVARSVASGTGILTAGLAVGQYNNGALVEEYDGTNWTAVTALPVGKYGVFGGMGTQTDCLYAGGHIGPGTPIVAVSNTYDGTNWSTSPSLATARGSGASGGTSALAFVAGGNAVPTVGSTATEEWTGQTSTANIVTLTTS